MEKFEIHITGSFEILEELYNLKIKSLKIALLKPNTATFRLQYMSSTVQEFKCLEEAVKWTEGLSTMLESKGVQIIRKKIESPYYEHYINKALYLESHWKSDYADSLYPMSMINEKIVFTERAYDKGDWGNFMKRQSVRGIEMCLYDTYISEDFDWFNLY